MRLPLYFVAVLGALAGAACNVDLTDRAPADMTALSQSKPLGGETGLDADLRLGVGALELTVDRNARLYSLDVEYDKNRFQPEVNYDPSADSSARLSVRLENNSRNAGYRNETNRIRLGVSDAVPLRLSVKTGVGESRLALSGLQIARLDFETGVGGVKISAYDPNKIDCERIRMRAGVGGMNAVGLGNLNFREFDFEGGVGGADLDFTGEWKRDAEIRIQVGVGGVTVRMPRGIGVAVDTTKHFLSGIHLDGFERRDSRYYSRDYDQSKFRVSLRVSTGVGGFRITWV
jgi:hypothetical protein